MYPRGQEGFEEFYTGIYGHRWTALRSALLAGAQHVAWVAGEAAVAGGGRGAGGDDVAGGGRGAGGDDVAGEAAVAGPARRTGEPYHLDPASVLVAGLLPLANADSVVDLCAAPGGKSLVLAGQLRGSSSLICNERSRARRARLQRVLDRHLDPEIRARVSVTGHDAARWALYRPDSVDAVLADVPCSSEQHVLADAGALQQWSAGRSRRLSIQQGAILAAAIDAAAPGGWILYVTCALAPAENDGVVERILRKRAGRVALSMPDAAELRETATRLLGEAPYVSELVEGVEWTDHGLMILPDLCAGAGPLFAARLRRAYP